MEYGEPIKIAKFRAKNKKDSRFTYAKVVPCIVKKVLYDGTEHEFIDHYRYLANNGNYSTRYKNISLAIIDAIDTHGDWYDFEIIYKGAWQK